MSEKSKLRITTVTPVTIGSGVELSPNADYIIDKEQVCFIDKGRMVKKIMQKGDSYLDRYVYGVTNGMDNNRSTFDLKSFLLNNQIVQSLEEVVSFRCPFTGDPKNNLPIKGLIKSPLAKPYFPGSSIKGALKTILMYNWLITNKNADKTIERVINDGNFDWLEKQFEYKEDDISRDIIRKNFIQQVTDSRMLLNETNIVVDCERKISLRFECIAKNQSTEFELTLENYKWENLAKQANKFAEDVLEREFTLVENDNNLLDYYDFLVDIEKTIIGAQENVAYLRVGFGKGYYLNSLGIAIFNYVNQDGKKVLYDKFEKFINKQFTKKDKYGNKQAIDLDDFPKTRLFVKKTQEPLGWIRIEKIS